MITRLLTFFGIIVVVAGLAPATFAQDSGRSPNILGTWTGSATAAYVKSHPQFGDSTATVELELNVYKQQGNLIWMTQKWRREGQSDWNEADSIGSFFAHENDEFMIIEMATPPSSGAAGFFMGEIDDGQMELTYTGTESGVAFNTVLNRQ
ncbi:MAG: hypothetical protein AAF724_09540 [Pseudomonadota bacterium]